METLSPFTRFRPDADELDPAPLDPATIQLNKMAPDHFASLSNKYGIEAMQHMGAINAMFMTASAAASAMASIATILDQAAVIVGKGAADTRAHSKAAGVRVKAMLDLFAALRVRGEITVREAEAYMTVAKTVLTPIFDDVL
jgi:hypothetical protein